MGELGEESELYHIYWYKSSSWLYCMYNADEIGDKLQSSLFFL